MLDWAGCYLAQHTLQYLHCTGFSYKLCTWMQQNSCLPTCGNDLLTCGNDLLSCWSDSLSCGNDLLSCGNDLLTCVNNLVSCGNDFAKLWE